LAAYLDVRVPNSEVTLKLFIGGAAVSHFIIIMRTEQ
jgi:hypothetical protein